MSRTCFVSNCRTVRYILQCTKHTFVVLSRGKVSPQQRRLFWNDKILGDREKKNNDIENDGDDDDDEDGEID